MREYACGWLDDLFELLLVGAGGSLSDAALSKKSMNESRGPVISFNTDVTLSTSFNPDPPPQPQHLLQRDHHAHRLLFAFVFSKQYFRSDPRKATCNSCDTAKEGGHRKEDRKCEWI